MHPKSEATIVVVESCGKVQERWKTSATNQQAKVEARHGSTRAPTFVARAIRSLETTFLPAGYPDSVTPDYLTYQVFDTLQALCSTITGTLSTRAVLKGVGVGDATATAMSGTVSWLLRDGAGMIGRILFASVVASDLDHDAKRWRLAADVTNDIDMFINILSEHVAREYFVYLGCVSSLFFAVTGTAGGATRTSLTRHFSVSGFSVADLSAKEGNQETAVNLIGMFIGMGVAYVVPQSFAATFSVVLLFTILHLVANYLGVKSLILEYLNENRLVICLDHFLMRNIKNHGHQSKKTRHLLLPTPIEMRSFENVVFPGKRIATGGIKIGVSLRDLLGDDRGSSANVQQAIESLNTKGYYCAAKRGEGDAYGIVLANTKSTSSATSDDDDCVLMKRIFLGYVECVVQSCEEKMKNNKKGKDADQEYSHEQIHILKTNPGRFLEELKSAGWRVDRFQLRVDDWRVSFLEEDDTEDEDKKIQ